MKITFVQGDITEQDVDAIVNAANHATTTEPGCSSTLSIQASSVGRGAGSLVQYWYLGLVRRIDDAGDVARAGNDIGDRTAEQP